MRLTDMAEMLDARVLSAPQNRGPDVTHAFASDLMSDVLTMAKPGSVLLTGLTNPQVVRTSEVAGVVAIVFVRGKRAHADTERLAREAGIYLFETPLTLFESCGRLYCAGLRGCD